MSKEPKIQNSSAPIECPNCGESSVESRYVAEKFKYGDQEKSVELEALVPFRKCMKCQFEFTDAEAEDAMHETICRYLHRMTPADVADVRKRYGMNRDEFAAATDIGSASLGRWESGQLIQTAAYDNYLYLLTFPENMERIAGRRQPIEAETHGLAHVPAVPVLPNNNPVITINESRVSHRFRIIEKDAVEQAGAFALARRPRVRRCMS